MLYLDSTAQVPTWRQYTPYGETRGTAVIAPDDRGFLDKTIDGTTGLTNIGARDYDPVTGRFISGDPQFEPESPGELNGYSYTANNPGCQSDPTGEKLDEVAAGRMSENEAESYSPNKTVAVRAQSRWVVEQKKTTAYHHSDQGQRDQEEKLRQAQAEQQR